MRTRIHTAITCAALAASAATAQADDSLNVYGFVNIGAYYLDEEDITIESYEAEETRFLSVTLWWACKSVSRSPMPPVQLCR